MERSGNDLKRKAEEDKTQVRVYVEDQRCLVALFSHTEKGEEVPGVNGPHACALPCLSCGARCHIKEMRV